MFVEELLLCSNARRAFCCSAVNLRVSEFASLGLEDPSSCCDSSKVAKAMLDFLRYGGNPCFLKHTSIVWPGLLQHVQIFRPFDFGFCDGLKVESVERFLVPGWLS